MGDAKEWFLPAGRTFRVELKGTGTGLWDLHVAQIEGDRETKETVFNKIPVDPSMRGSMTVTPLKTAHTIAIRHEGHPDIKEIRPSAVVGGKGLGHGPAPEVTATLSGTSGLGGWFTSDVSVVLSAVDRGQGILSIMYKHKGNRTYQPYTGPIVVSVEGTNTILAGATDRVGQDQPRPTEVPSESTRRRLSQQPG